MPASVWEIFITLGVPGLALGVFYALFKGLKWDFPKVPKAWVGPIVVLFMVLIAAVTSYALTLFKPVGKGEKLKAGKLILENIIHIPRDPSSKYELGSWSLEINDTEGLWEYARDLSRFSKGEWNDRGVFVIRNKPDLYNNLGVGAYEITWREETQSRDERIRKILENENSYSQNHPELVEKYLNGSELSEEDRERLNRIYLMHSRHPWVEVDPIKLRFVVRNVGGTSITVHGIKFENMFFMGGGAGAGGSSISVVNQERVVHLSWDKDAYLQFHNPISIMPGDTTMLEVIPIVDDAAMGDGPGELGYRASIEYFDGMKSTEYFIGLFIQPDSA